MVNLLQHMFAQVGKCVECRPKCTTPVVLRCNQSNRFQRSPIRWGSRRRWFCPQCFGTFLPSNLGMLRCRRSLLYPLDKSLRLWDRIGSILFALECILLHWIPVDMHRRHNFYKLWCQTSRHTFRVHIQCRHWIHVWRRKILVGKPFGWQLPLHKNDLSHILGGRHSNCKNPEAPNCMPWNHFFRFQQNRLGIACKSWIQTLQL